MIIKIFTILCMFLGSNLYPSEEDNRNQNIPQGLNPFNDKNELSLHLEKNYPHLFQGSRKERSLYSNPDRMYGLLKEFCYYQNEKTTITPHMIKYCQNQVSSEHFLIKEMKEIMMKGWINNHYLAGWPIRLAASRSQISSDEASFYENVFPEPQIHRLLSQLCKAEQWKNPLIQVLFLGDTENQLDNPLRNISTIYPTLLSWGYKNILRPSEYFNEVPLLLINEGKLGIWYLSDRLLKNIFPIAVPEKEIVGHGVRMSPLGFTVHDYLHLLVDGRQKILEQSLLQYALDYSNHGDYDSFIRAKRPQLLCYQHYKIQQGLLKFSDHLLSHFLPVYGFHELTKLMVPLFIMIHEFQGWSQNLYHLYDLRDILNSIVNTSIKVIQNAPAESPADPLETSPIDGKSLWTNKKIKEYFLNNLKRENKELASNVKRQKIVREERFIQSIFYLKNGKTPQDRFVLTLFHKWGGIEDYNGLLNLCGEGLQKPDLTKLGHLEARKTAIDYVKDTQEALGQKYSDL